MKKTVLIIEDSPTYYSFLKDFLSPKGFEVLPNEEDFNDMLEAMDRDTDSPYNGRIDKYVMDYLKREEQYKEIDLILCDIKFDILDDEGGIDLIKEIRACTEFNPFYWAYMVPIVAITDYASNDNHVNKEFISKIGANDFYRKETIMEEPNEFRYRLDSLIQQFQGHFTLTPYPEDIAKSIINFRRKHQKTNAFIMTSFKHIELAQKVSTILTKHNIEGHIANHEGGLNKNEKLPNIRAFMHGCDFGIGLYADDSGLPNTNLSKDKKIIRANPNLCLEVGYMLGLQKNVCFLKYHSLDKINTDLDEKLFVDFDDSNLESKLVEWLENKGFIEKTDTKS